MPTGTGKTGVIAVLSVALPPTAWTLILTPWSNLCDQMLKDVKERFWKKWKPSPSPKVARLFPSTLDEIIPRNEPQLVLVATFATLVTIFKQHREGYDKLAAKLSQVFVDEGHYEPAPEWGQAVKHLEKPTVLLTATPYRNDLKLFRVAKDDVHHYTHKAAEGDRIIRGLKFKPLDIDEPDVKHLPSWCDEFAKFWRGYVNASPHKGPRAIICCAKMATVERVTRLMRDRRINALGIHERFGGRRVDYLTERVPEPKQAEFDVWVHQNKLTEGLDDSRFCVLGVLNRIRNERKLIQQIGRVLRRGANGLDEAWVLYSRDLKIKESWTNYREFETQPDSVDPERYHRILKEIFDRQPPMEYFGGRFRRRFEADSPELRCAVLLRASAVVRRVGRKFRMDEFADYTSDFLLLEDRILLGPNKGPFQGPGDSRLWVYATFANSPLLMEHSQYEVRLGAMAAVKHGGLLFLVDTEGIYPSHYLMERTKKLSRDELGRIFSQGIVPKEVSLINPWPAGPTVRRSTVYAGDLASTPAQLTDTVFVCAGVRATVHPEKKGQRSRRQYIGFQRGRISEQITSTERATFSFEQFTDWTRELAEKVESEKRKMPGFFHRYLSPVAPPDVVIARYLVLNLFDGDVELQDESGRVVEIIEPIVEVGPNESDDSKGTIFQFRLRYREEGVQREGHVDGVLAYDLASARFRLRGDRLNSQILVASTSKTEAEGFCNYMNNNNEAFTVALDKSDFFYTSENFYRIDYSHAEERLADLLIPRDTLRKVKSEKGTRGKGKTQWDASSVFAVIDDRKSTSLLSQNFGPFEFLFCDDLGKEIADFVCVSFGTRKIAFVHAKHGKDRKVSASALHDVVAQALKNLGVFARSGPKPAHLGRWNRRALWAGTKILRWRRGSETLPVEDDLWAKIRSDILEHPDGKKEVWLVVGQSLEKMALVEQLQDPQKRDAVTGQIVHLLSYLHASCSQIGVELKVFCH
jgi:superfamily II DNA or RNA helicase